MTTTDKLIILGVIKKKDHYWKAKSKYRNLKLAWLTFSSDDKDVYNKFKQHIGYY